MSSSPTKCAPAFDFYPERWTHGTRHMTKIERCDYLDLLCHQWTENGLPNDLDMIARLLGYKKPTQIPPLVLEKFPIADDGRRRNKRLEDERVKQIARIDKKRNGAAITNQKRWGKRQEESSLSDQIATHERLANESPPPTTHHRSPNGEVPPLPPNESFQLSDDPPPAGGGRKPKKSDKGITEGETSKLIPTTEQSKRIAAIFHRQATTPWTEKEVSAYKKLGTIPPDDLATVERYYAENWPPAREINVLRHNLVTFLNNFASELDRARASTHKPNANAKTTTTSRATGGANLPDRYPAPDWSKTAN